MYGRCMSDVQVMYDVGVKVFFTWVSADFPESAYSSCSLGVNYYINNLINQVKAVLAVRLFYNLKGTRTIQD